MQYFGMVDSSRIANLLHLCGICLLGDGTVGNTRNNRKIFIKCVELFYGYLCIYRKFKSIHEDMNLYKIHSLEMFII